MKLVDRICLWLGYEYSPIDGEPIYWPGQYKQDPESFERLRLSVVETNKQFVREGMFKPYMEANE